MNLEWGERITKVARTVLVRKSLSPIVKNCKTETVNLNQQNNANLHEHETFFDDGSIFLHPWDPQSLIEKI